MPVTLKSLSEFTHGVTWEVDEGAKRTSHAIRTTDGRVWLIDPVDHADAIERAKALGDPHAVLQLIDRHNRDCAAVAARLGVPHIEVPDAVPDSPFEAIAVLRMSRWRETALWWPETGLLVVAEAVGTADAFTFGHGAVGMHLMLRPFPPGALRGYEPEHLLVGHGPAVHGATAREGVAFAYAHARRDIPRLPLAVAKLVRDGWR